MSERSERLLEKSKYQYTLGKEIKKLWCKREKLKDSKCLLFPIVERNDWIEDETSGDDEQTIFYETIGECDRQNYRAVAKQVNKIYKERRIER